MVYICFFLTFKDCEKLIHLRKNNEYIFSVSHVRVLLHNIIL
jgi:hypothetical protein